MDPALWELLRGSTDDREVEAIVRLDRPQVGVAGVRIVSRFGRIATCRLRKDSILEVRRDENVVSLKAARALGPEHLQEENGDTAWERRGRDGDRRRPPGLLLTGAGVTVGFVDWGCDVDHPNFKHRDGSTRLWALWDQRGPAARGAPQPYGYGVLHHRGQINRALRTADPYAALGYHPADADRDGSGAHGSHVMDIAAGNGSAGGPVGIAPEADLVFVHLAERGTSGLANLGDSVRILEAVDFIARTAGHRPWVINISVGRHGGPHDGCTLAELALDAVLRAAPSRFIVQSAGNYFASRTHASGWLEQGQLRSLTMVTHEADVTPNELEIWYGGEDELMVRVGSPTGRQTDWVRLGETVDVIEDDLVVGRIYHRDRDPNNYDNHVELFLYPWAPAGPWDVDLQAGRIRDGAFHAWLERDEACAECQAHFVEGDVDRACTTGTIANAHLPLVVGAYDAHAPDRQLARFSSAGPTRDGRLKPDLIAPGVGVLAARSAPQGSVNSPGLMTRKSGTSMAAPHVTGAVALCLEAAPDPMTAEEIRSLLLETARPPTTAAEPGSRSGFGYLDLARALTAVSAPGRPASSPPPRPNVKERQMEIYGDRGRALPVTLSPDTLYRDLVAGRDGPVSAWVHANFDVLARPGEAPPTEPRAEDVLVRVALGEPGLGHVAVLADSGLLPHGVLNRAGIMAEHGGPGFYATVIEGGAFPHARSDRFARRVLDQGGRMPPGQVLLRPTPPIRSDEPAKEPPNQWDVVHPAGDRSLASEHDRTEIDLDIVESPPDWQVASPAPTSVEEQLGEEASGEVELAAELLTEVAEETPVAILGVVVFPSGESLTIVQGPEGKGEEYYDPTGSKTPLLDMSDPNRSKQLSKNFTAGEFAKSGGRKFEKARISADLVECLQRIRDQVGRAVQITSGYRSHGHNQRLRKGGKKYPVYNSRHQAGLAADIAISGMTGVDIAKAAIDACGCNIGVGIGLDFAHVDVRDKFAVWRYQKGVTETQKEEVLRHHSSSCGAKQESDAETTPFVLPEEGLAFIAEEEDGGPDNLVIDTLAEQNVKDLGKTAPSGAVTGTTSATSPATIGFEFDLNVGLWLEVFQARKAEMPPGSTFPVEHEEITTHTWTDTTGNLKDGFRVKRDGPRLEIATIPIPLHDKATFDTVVQNSIAFAKELEHQRAQVTRDRTISVSNISSFPVWFTHPTTKISKLPLVVAPRGKSNALKWPSDTKVWAAPQATITIELGRVSELIVAIENSVGDDLGKALSGGRRQRLGVRSDLLVEARKSVLADRARRLGALLSDGSKVSQADYSDRVTGLLILMTSYMLSGERIDPDDYEGFAKGYLPLNVKAPFRDLFHGALSGRDRQVFEELYFKKSANFFALAKPGATDATGDTEFFPPMAHGDIDRFHIARPTWKTLLDNTVRNLPLLVTKDNTVKKKNHKKGDEVLFAPLSTIIPFSATKPRVAIEMRRIGYAAHPHATWKQLMITVRKLATMLNP